MTEPTLPGVTYTATRDIALDDLTRYPGNPRRGDVEALRASTRRHGQYRSLVVRDTGTQLVVLAGNHTSEALRAEGAPAARCEVIECTDDQARRINLADNKLAELGTYDEEDLAAMLVALDGDLDAIETVLRLSERRSRLYGLDAAARLEVALALLDAVSMTSAELEELLALGDDPPM
ncbi:MULTISPECIES: ParB N-terminal domain-containing protein [unclassified Streptomyces]|uniref:ParB N-terminal domain-containing protein n=1 Tax=unclassified Streptomyces TaxID=2593676 RepID=UPI0034453731